MFLRNSKILKEREVTLGSEGTYLTVFYIVRHGITRSNQEGRHLGQREEDLTEEGRQQARNLAELLRNEPLDIIYTSPLRRARDTASEIVRYHPGKGPLSDPRLTELHMGIFDGLLPGEARRASPEDYAARESNKFGFRIPSGESYRILEERVDPFIRDTIEEYPNGNVCIVGHQGLNRALLGVLFRSKITDREMKIPYLEIPHDAYFKIVKTGPDVSGQLISGPFRINMEERL